MRKALFFAILACSVAFLQMAHAGTWREATQADFADGDYNANVFSSTDGNDGGCLKSAPGSTYDLDKDGKTDVVISNMQGSNSYIYWGTDAGFDSTNRTFLPTNGATGNSIADLNKDGCLDILFSCFNGSFSIIYWGSKDGFSNSDTTLLESSGAHGNYICDLNHDGGLDIIISNWWGSYSYIYWGDNKGHFTSYKRTDLPTSQSYDVAVADLNKDGRLDIVFSNGWDSSHNSFIYWGQGTDSIYYSTACRTLLNAGHDQGVSIGDLNKDGWLDIVLSNNGDDYVDNSYIYWGDSSGFSDSNRKSLPTLGARGNAIVDIDRDGNDDLIFAQWYDGITHDIPSYIYWGPDFSTVGRTELQGHGAVGPLVGKFVKGSSDIQILLTNGIQGPGFSGTTVNTNTYLYSIDHSRNVTLEDSVPSVYAHLSTKDNGNAHNRSKTEVYGSSVFGNGTDTYEWGNCYWTAEYPESTSINVALRTGSTQIPDEVNWSGWIEVSKSGAKTSASSAKYAQYQVTYNSNSFLESPSVDEICIDYQLLTGVTGKDIRADCFDVKVYSNANGISISFNLHEQLPVDINIYNIQGRQVKNIIKGEQKAGFYEVSWNGLNNCNKKVSSGVYICRLKLGSKIFNYKAIMVK
jgi:hypothetical protein